MKSKVIKKKIHGNKNISDESLKMMSNGYSSKSIQEKLDDSFSQEILEHVRNIFLDDTNNIIVSQGKNDNRSFFRIYETNNETVILPEDDISIELHNKIKHRNDVIFSEDMSTDEKIDKEIRSKKLDDILWKKDTERRTTYNKKTSLFKSSGNHKIQNNIPEVVESIIDYCQKNKKINPMFSCIINIGLYMRKSTMVIPNPTPDVVNRILINLNESDIYILDPRISSDPFNPESTLIDTNLPKCNLPIGKDAGKNIMIDFGRADICPYRIKILSNPINSMNSPIGGKNIGSIRRAKYERITIIIDFKDNTINTSLIKELAPTMKDIVSSLTSNQIKLLMNLQKKIHSNVDINNEDFQKDILSVAEKIGIPIDKVKSIIGLKE